jgi:hypothetical protein
VRHLIIDKNPNGTITNSDLELAGGLLHLDALSHCFDVHKRTVLSKGDNLSTTFWEWKGSTSSNKPPAFLLRLFGIHQRLHRYVPHLITSPAHPTTSPMPYHVDFTSLGLTSFFLSFCFRSPMDVRFGLHCSRLFPP